MAKLQTIESSAEFLLLLEKSSLLAGGRLEAARTVCGARADSRGAARQLIKDGLLTTWQANQLLGGFVALTVGPYKLMDQIGKGELGRVYLAEHSQMGNRVALKVLASKSASDPKLVERFFAEARAAGEFEHQNVLRVLDVSSDPNRPYVVTEFVSGGDLQQRVEKRGPLPALEAASLVAQTAEGMAYVHGKNVLHRDLKPANLLVDDKGIVKILDVGVGHLRQAAKPGDEATGVMLLSALGYMSPEQVRGKELDSRSDIYALGGTLYFLLTGRVPYTAASNEERDLIRETKRPVPVNKLKPDLPAALVKLCDQMMALKGSDRPAGMQDVAQLLRRFLAGDETVQPVDEEAQPQPAVETAEAPATESNAVAKTVRISKTAIENGQIEEVAETKSQSAKVDVVESSAGSKPVVAEKVVISLGDGGSGPTPAVMPQGFKIQKKKKADITAAAGGGEIDPALAAIAQKAKRQRRVLIGTAAASLVVIAIGIVVMVMSGGDDSAVVQQGAPVQPPAASASSGGQPAATGGLAADDPENMPDPESIPDAQVATVPTPANNSLATAASPAPTELAGTPPAAATPSTGQPAAVTPSTTGEPGALVPGGTPAAASSPASTPSSPEPVAAASATPMPIPSTPTTPAVATPDPAATTAANVPTATTATTPDSATPPSDAPATPAASPVPDATVEKEEEPNAEAKKSEPMPRAKSAKTFEIAAAVDLPRLPAADGSAPADSPAKVLGMVNIDPKDACFLSMYGGDKALRGGREFLLRNAAGGTAPRDWEFVAKDSGGAETVIAKLALPETDLEFEWTPDGLKDPSAGAISNCVLKITAGQEKPHFVALRTAARLPPMTVENIERSSPSVRFNLDAVPDSAALRFEPSIPGQKSVFESGGADLTKADPWIFLGESKEQAPLGLKLDVTINNRGIQIAAVPYVLVPGEKPQKLTPTLRKKLSVADLQRQVTVLGGQVEAIKKMKKEDQQKLQNELNLAGLARENLDKRIQRIQSLDAVIQQLSGAQIQFRISYDTGESQVALIETSADAAAGEK